MMRRLLLASSDNDPEQSERFSVACRRIELSLFLSLFFSRALSKIILRVLRRVHSQPTTMCGTNIYVEGSCCTRESSYDQGGRPAGGGYAPAGVTHPAGYSRAIDPVGYESKLRGGDHTKSIADVSIRH